MTINTLYELARNSVEKFASKVAFSMFEGDDVTYAEVGRRIEKVQEILTCAGLHAGDKVALLSSNMPNWVYAISPSLRPAWSPCRSCPIFRARSST